MRSRTRWIALASVGAVLAVAGMSLSGPLAARRAAREAALEADVMRRNIAFFEKKFAGDTLNWLLGGHLADLYTLRFRAEAKLDDVARAEELARATLPFRVERSGAYARLSAILLTQHRFTEAYDAARQAVAVPFPVDAALGAFVDAARAIGDNAAADSALARMDRNSFGASVRLADRYAGEGRSDAAMRAVSRACDRLDETGATRELRAWCLTKLAMLEHNAHGPEAARPWLRRALALRPHHRGATEELANLAYAEQDWREARKLYSRIAASAHPDIYLRLAEVSRASGDDDAAAVYERTFVTVASEPGLETLNALPLALHYAAVGKCADAMELAQRELTRRHSAEAFESVAWVSYECGDMSGAAHTLARAAAAAAPTASALYLSALLMQKSGAEAEASALLAQATADLTRLEPHVLEHMRRGRHNSP
jgi:tetratricopeptide (TPR) repeat protein